MLPYEFLEILETFPFEYGVVRDQYSGEDAKRFVLIFQDDPENWSVRWAIGKALHHFKWVKVAGRDGAWGPIDTTLPYTIPDVSIQNETALYFLKRLLISPAEYANILRGKKYIHLFGVENQDLYKKAKKLYRDQPSFLRKQVERAHVIVNNLLMEMKKLGEQFSAVTCCGDLPDLVSEELERLGISYAVIRPKMSHPSDRRLYKDVLAGKLPSYEEILTDEKASIDLQPEDEEFPDKKKEEMKEQARIGLIRLIKSGELLPKLESLLPHGAYNKVTRILNSSDYGPKSKAVLVKAELLSLVKPLQAKLTRRRELRLGVIGLVAAIVGAIFGFGVTFLWYRKGVAVLFGLAVLNALLVKRIVSAFRWLLNILGFFYGFSLFGRWGMLLGVVLATIIGSVLVGRELRAIRHKADYVLRIQKILIGIT